MPRTVNNTAMDRSTLASWRFNVCFGTTFPFSIEHGIGPAILHSSIDCQKPEGAKLE